VVTLILILQLNLTLYISNLDLRKVEIQRPVLALDLVEDVEQSQGVNDIRELPLQVDPFYKLDDFDDILSVNLADFLLDIGQWRAFRIMLRFR
jgi:hypothetical protein